MENKNATHSENSSYSKSCFQQTVCLKEWWLIKSDTEFEGKSLAVAGFTSTLYHKALRVFTSAPILKIYDVFTLETVDGICVVLKGFINKSRTEENGFPSEVFNHFLFGFPPHWEAYYEQCLQGESKVKAVVSDARGRQKPSLCSDNVKDLKQTEQKNHVEAIGEETHGRNRRKDCEEEDILNSDHQNDEDVASEDNVRNRTNKAVRSSYRLHSTKTAKKQTADHSKETHFRSGSASTKNAKRKLAYESPVSQKGKEAHSVTSPEPLSLRRSRSGRLLLPPMAFWRNQRAIYDADQMITAINQGDEDLDVLSRVSRSEPSRKRRPLK